MLSKTNKDPRKNVGRMAPMGPNNKLPVVADSSKPGKMTKKGIDELVSE